MPEEKDNEKKAGSSVIKENAIKHGLQSLQKFTLTGPFAKGGEANPINLAPVLTIYKDSNDNMSSPRRMARLNGYYDAVTNGKDWLDQYGGVRFLVDARSAKDKQKGKKKPDKDMTNVYLRAFRRALKRPEFYSEKYKDTGSKLGNIASTARRYAQPNYFKSDADDAKDYTRKYVSARNERLGYENHEWSENMYDRTPVLKERFKNEYGLVTGKMEPYAAMTYNIGYDRKYNPTIRFTGAERLKVGRTGGMSAFQKGSMAHEYNHAAEDVLLSNGKYDNLGYENEFLNLDRTEELLTYDFGNGEYVWAKKPGELRAEVVCAKRMNGLDPETPFKDLDLMSKYKIIDYLTERFHLDRSKSADMRLMDMLENEEYGFREGGKLFRRKKEKYF